jgi:hypothetical protein
MYIKEQIDELLKTTEVQNNELMPLVRLKIEYGQGNYSIVSQRKFNAYFEERISNHDFLQWYKKG